MNTLHIARKLYERYESLCEVKHYYGLIAIYGLLRTAEAGSDKELLQKCKEILSRFPDDITHPSYNFPSYTIGGIPKAYAVYKGYLPQDEDQVREYAEEMMSAPRDQDGILIKPQNIEQNLIWVDVATAATTFLLFAGLHFNEEKYIQEGIKQVLLMVKEFKDPENGLLHQCKNFVAPGVYSEDHWSRGNAWALFPLTELLLFLPENHAKREEVKQVYLDFIESICNFQTKNGLWRQEIPFEYSYEETSGSAFFIYCIGVGLRLGILEESIYRPRFIRGLEGLMKISINSNFSTNNSCNGCLCPGEGEEKGSLKSYVLVLPLKDEVHGFGPLILAMTEAYQNGITSLEMKRK